MYVDDDFSRRIAHAAFPSYNGKKFEVRAQSYPLNCRSSWQGGSRSYYVFVNLANMQASPEMPAQSAFDPEVKELNAVTLPEGVVCVEHVIFCGKDLGIRIIAHPDNFQKLIPQIAAEEVTEDEKKYLRVCRGLISSARPEELRRMGINSAQKEELKASLIQKGFLAKGGGLTLKGKNYAETLPRL